ncbi:hypothetical protein PENTCL1PPCAC_11371, partial [Pristionchus entomophagus]
GREVRHSLQSIRYGHCPIREGHRVRLRIWLGTSNLPRRSILPIQPYYRHFLWLRISREEQCCFPPLPLLSTTICSINDPIELSVNK